MDLALSVEAIEEQESEQAKMRQHRLVPLDQVPEEERPEECLWCDDAPDWRQVKAVMALEHQNKTHRFFGICGNHAEVMDVTTEWKTF